LNAEHIPLALASQARTGGEYQGTALRARLFTALLHAATAAENNQLRSELDSLADLTWDRLHHLARTDPTQPAIPVDLNAYGENQTPNWHNILCVVEGLSAAMELPDIAHGNTQLPLSFTHQLLADADEMLGGLTASPHAGTPDARVRVQARLERARTLLETRPAHATALLHQCIVELDELMAEHTTDHPPKKG
jgi:hypothetical protein